MAIDPRAAQFPSWIRRENDGVASIMPPHDPKDPEERKLYLRYCIGILAIIGAVVGFVCWSMQQKPKELTPPAITLTVAVEPDEGLKSEQITIDLLLVGGGLGADRKLASSSTSIGPVNPATRLCSISRVRRDPLQDHQQGGAVRWGAEGRRRSATEEQPLILTGDTTVYYVRSADVSGLSQTSDGFQCRYGASLQAKAGSHETLGGILDAAKSRWMKTPVTAAGGTVVMLAEPTSGDSDGNCGGGRQPGG